MKHDTFLGETAAPHFLELPADVLQEKGVLRLLEAPDVDAHQLVRQLREGIYPRPFVLDDGKVRRLYFSLALVQSEMLLADPYALHAAYTREMMGFMLFAPRPKHIVLVGLGGGSLAKFCQRHLARSRITVLEIDPDVIAFRSQFALPPDDERFRVLCADAVEYFALRTESADVVLLDGYDENGIVGAFCDERFYLNLRAQLKPNALLVCNLAQRDTEGSVHLDLLREVFADRVVVQDVPGDGNRIAFAFNDPPFPPDMATIDREARMLSQRTGLDFESIARRLEKNLLRQKRRR
ncbi:MAG: spermidine synthase [Betaproteobacteria bacterium]|nr:spermidine synthase [Betaproteobacteria bacterium]